ncbi:PP-loop family protein [Paraphaeosphaeria minitans]|uniref:tRNA(Ile)-lysidine synthetase n=1 Tax=Paraphaeosphaeria minitans TaxID=565426 RepID=A0A9P6GU09_9PLEO|nr:PP-loop family protein [Paraphaeosphaeria minitans]
MWKRNAVCLCLRTYSSALASRGWARKADGPRRHVRDAIGSSYAILGRHAHTQYGPVKAAGAIADDEFLEALRRVLPVEKLQPASPPVGLAVSGGVDSMAIATLYSRCRQSHQLPELHGIIVDHKARPASGEEAQWVAEQLLTPVGVESTIVPLVWPQGFDLLTSTRFEAEARKWRHEALGKTCRDKGITSLIMGQHKDDQAETILMRLFSNRHRSGLAATTRIGWIPECFGVYGVHHSGSPASDKSSVASLFEHGGMRVLRPMLDFEKSRLIATCEMHATRWAEDATNKDKTLTARNAVRHILQNHKLPEALSKGSVVSLGQNVQSRLEKHKAAAAALYSACSFKLDIQTGALVIRFPPVEAFFPGSDPDHVPSPSEKLQARATAQYLVQAIIRLVSPREHLVLETIANSVIWFWPSLRPDNLPPISYQYNSTNDCYFSQLHQNQQRQTDDPGTGHLGPWCISRQPPSEPKFANIRIDFPPGQTSDWRLFDGRYWIRVQNHTARSISLGFLTDRKLEALMQLDPAAKGYRNLLDSGFDARASDRRKQLRAALEAVKPHRLRRHLPALFLEPELQGGDPELLALPTLQASPDDPSDHWECRWEIKYKKVDPGAGRTLNDIVTRPVFHPLETDALTLEQEATKAQLDALGLFDPVPAPKDLAQEKRDKKKKYRERLKLRKKQEQDGEPQHPA